MFIQRRTRAVTMRRVAALCAGTAMILLTGYSQQRESEVARLTSILRNRNEPGPSRFKAAEELRAIGSSDTTAISSLIACFADPDPFLNGKAAELLGLMGTAAVPGLTTALHAADANVRWCAAIALGKTGTGAREAVPSLIDALNDSSANVRWCSAIALGNLRTDAARAAPALRARLMDDDEDVRWSAYYALSRLSTVRVERTLTLSRVIAVLDSVVPRLISELHVPGVSIALVDGRRMCWSKSYGLKDARTSEPVTDQTLFEACSMSKPVLALLAMRLVENKKLDLDRPLCEYLPEHFASTGDYGKRITARIILSHTAGFPNWRKGEEETAGPLPIYFTPGTQFSYSGEGFFYLQRVIEKLTGEPLDLHANNALFGPLGLKQSSFVWTTDMAPFQASGHDTAGCALPRTKYLHPNAAYTLYTSAEEYAKIICSLLRSGQGNERFLSAGSMQEMTRHHIRVDVRTPVRRPGRALGLGVYWGLGWAIDSTMSGNIVYHSGANRSGFRCYAQFDYDQGSGIVIMTNGVNGSELWRRVVERVGDF